MLNWMLWVVCKSDQSDQFRTVTIYKDNLLRYIYRVRIKEDMKRKSVETCSSLPDRPLYTIAIDCKLSNKVFPHSVFERTLNGSDS